MLQQSKEGGGGPGDWHLGPLFLARQMFTTTTDVHDKSWKKHYNWVGGAA
jgi:hypothetical protein